MSRIAALSPEQHAEIGDCILVAWAGALNHLVPVLEAAYREGFSAAQIGTADCSAAWQESEAKVIGDANQRVADWALRAVRSSEIVDHGRQRR